MKNNPLKKAFSILMPVGIVLTLLQSTRAKAENNIIWKAVPGTAIVREGNPKPQPDYIGTNTSIRRGENVVFDAYIDGQYVLYAGNCRKQMLYRLSIGSFDNKRQPQNVKPYPNEKWFRANNF
ncbi:MAG: hypothetical protein WA959_01205 [Rivularia sp. (in: cyanobacteria)]